MSRFVSEALGAHDRGAFSSGNERIDHYFRHLVTQDIKRRYAVCHVLIDQANGAVAGFHTLSSYTVALADLPIELARKLPRYPTVPAVLIGWMGRDLAFRGQHIGALLLADVIRRLALAPVGAHALCADAIDPAAEAFYLAHQFQPLGPRPGRVFLPMKTALSLIGQA
jgi:GNAT superfamily N-acetyltransferase